MESKSRASDPTSVLSHESPPQAASPNALEAAPTRHMNCVFTLGFLRHCLETRAQDSIVAARLSDTEFVDTVHRKAEV
jgi:hypothetical protein